MRKQFIKTVEEIMDSDNRVVLILGDIGVFGFKKLFEKYPDRVYNIGILEQSMISLASGLALSGLIPIVYTISPFIVNRANEQLKIDFGYQNVGGNFVSVGASYDYASLGSTHHCPDDVGVLKQNPNMEIVVAGHELELDHLFKSKYANGKPTYFRLSEHQNYHTFMNEKDKAQIIRNGKDATVLVVGNMLDTVVKACEDLDVSILYYNVVSPFDYMTLKENWNQKVIICEPYYSGSLICDIVSNIKLPAKYDHIGVPKEFINQYGTYDEINRHYGLTSDQIKIRIKEFINVD